MKSTISRTGKAKRFLVSSGKGCFHDEEQVLILAALSTNMPSQSEFSDLLRYQNMLAQQVARQAGTDKKITFLQLVARLSGTSKKKVQTALLIHEAETQGFSESEAYAVLEELEHEGMIAAAGEGYVKRG